MIFKVKVAHYKTEHYIESVRIFKDDEYVVIQRPATRTVLTHSTYKVYDNVVDAVHHNPHGNYYWWRGREPIQWSLFHSYPILDGDDVPYTIDHLQFLYENSPNQVIKGYARWGRKYRRRRPHTPATMQEMKANEASDVKVRPKRLHLPNSWDDHRTRRIRRNWKSFRRTQYAPTQELQITPEG